MKQTITLLTALLLAPLAALNADDTAKLTAILALASERGGVVTIPPEDYELDGQTPLKLSSGMTVSAYGGAVSPSEDSRRQSAGRLILGGECE